MTWKNKAIMTRFIEADYYTFPHFRKGFYLIEGSDCRKFCLNTEYILTFQKAELVMANPPYENREAEGTRIVLNDGTVYYVEIAYEQFKKMLM